jgi:hypothetical protein
MSFRFGESQDWVGWFRLRYTSTLFHPLGSHARGLLSTAEEFFIGSKIPVYRQVGKSKEQKLWETTTKPEWSRTARALKF